MASKLMKYLVSKGNQGKGDFVKWLTNKCRESESFANIVTAIGIGLIILIALIKF